MSDDVEFREVDDALREINPAGKRKNPAYAAIEAGKTVFIPFPDGVERYLFQNRVRSALAHRRVRVSQRTHEMDGLKGTLAWKVGDLP